MKQWDLIIVFAVVVTTFGAFVYNEVLKPDRDDAKKEREYVAWLAKQPGCAYAGHEQVGVTIRRWSSWAKLIEDGAADQELVHKLSCELSAVEHLTHDPSSGIYLPPPPAKKK